MLGVPVRLRDEATLDDLVHAPPPVEPGFLVALTDGPPLRLVCLLVAPTGAPRLPALARRVEFRLDRLGQNR